MLLISFSFQTGIGGHLSVHWNDGTVRTAQAAHRLEAGQAKRQDEPPVDVFPKCAHFESPRQEEHCSTPAEPWNSRPSSSVVHGRWPPCTGTLTRAGTLFGFRDSHECRRPVSPAGHPAFEGAQYCAASAPCQGAAVSFSCPGAAGKVADSVARPPMLSSTQPT